MKSNQNKKNYCAVAVCLLFRLEGSFSSCCEIRNLYGTFTTSIRTSSGARSTAVLGQRRTTESDPLRSSRGSCCYRQWEGCSPFSGGYSGKKLCNQWNHLAEWVEKSENVTWDFPERWKCILCLLKAAPTTSRSEGWSVPLNAGTYCVFITPQTWV